MQTDAIRSMLAWLADKDVDVRHTIAAQLNWDSAVPVLIWIVSQDDCDGATAISVAWMASPEYYADKLLSGRAMTASDDLALFQLILARFQRGAYPRNELAWFDYTAQRAAYYLEQLAGRPDPFDLPPAFFASAPGRPPRVPPDRDARCSPHVWDLLAALGTYAGRRPAGGASDPG